MINLLKQIYTHLLKDLLKILKRFWMNNRMMEL